MKPEAEGLHFVFIYLFIALVAFISSQLTRRGDRKRKTGSKGLREDWLFLFQIHCGGRGVIIRTDRPHNEWDLKHKRDVETCQITSLQPYLNRTPVS